MSFMIFGAHFRRCLIGAVAGAVLLGGAAHAENAWVRGDIRLNLRTGAGTQFRIVGAIATGDGVEILERGASWTKVRMKKDGKEGWIPEGYLQPRPPPTVAVSLLETQVGELTAQLEQSTTEAQGLRQSNEEISARDGEQRAEIDRLSLEVMEMSAGARWPEWITGASILLVGMLVGAMLHRNATRRPSSRIRI
jgi:uncharacterized protein YraI